jgi:hypothetical protein
MKFVENVCRNMCASLHVPESLPTPSYRLEKIRTFASMDQEYALLSLFNAEFPNSGMRYFRNGHSFVGCFESVHFLISCLTSDPSNMVSPPLLREARYRQPHARFFGVASTIICLPFVNQAVTCF